MLHSRPGYLQIIQDASTCPAGYEVPHSSVNLRYEKTLHPNGTNEIDHPRRELSRCTDSNSSITSVQVNIEPIQTTLVSSANKTNILCANGTAQITEVKKKKLVKPYAVIDVEKITTDKHIGASHGVLGWRKNKTKHQKHEELPSNREALNKSFALWSGSSATQVEQSSPSAGRYYTVPVYVNLNIPMTVNPSYDKRTKSSS